MLANNRLDRTKHRESRPFLASQAVSTTSTTSPYPPPYFIGNGQGVGYVTTNAISHSPVGIVVNRKAIALLDTIATTEHQKRTPSPLPTPSKPNRIKAKVESQAVLVDLLQDVGTPTAVSMAERIDACCSRWSVRRCSDGHILEFRPTISCHLKYCPFCAVKRANRSKNIYSPAIVEYLTANPHLKPFFLTLTLRHREGESAEAMFHRLKDACKRLRRRKYWEANFDGGVMSVEFTVGKDGEWHFHCHAIVFAFRSINPKDLANLWAEVTGDSDIIKVKRIKNTDSALVELIKYITKPSDIYQWTTSRMQELLKLKDKRFTEPFGTKFRKHIRDYNERQKQSRKEQPIERVDQFPIGDKCSRGSCSGEVMPDVFLPVSQLIHQLDTQTDWSQRIDDWETIEPPEWEMPDEPQWRNPPEEFEAML